MCIYGLFINEECQYIGSTNDLTKRTKDHMNALYGGKHKNKQLQKVFNEQTGKFESRILYEVDDSIINRYVAEYLFTSAYRPICNSIFNMSTGKFNWRMKLMDQLLADEWLTLLEGYMV